MKRAAFFLVLAVVASALSPGVIAPSRGAETRVSRNPEAIFLEVFIIRTNWGPNDESVRTLLGPSDLVDERLQELESAGQILAVDHISWTTLENEENQIHLGRTTPVPSGRSFRGPGGPSQMSYQQQSIGTQISAIASVDNGIVVVHLNVEKSELEQRDDQPEADGEFVPVGTKTLTSQVTVRVQDGTTALASGFENQGDVESSAQFVLVAARTLNSAPRLTAAMAIP